MAKNQTQTGVRNRIPVSPTGRWPAASDAAVERAAQFIPAGSRVLDLSSGKALAKTPADRLRLSAHREAAAIDFPAKAAAQSDIIVILGALEQVADLESLFTHLCFLQARRGAELLRRRLTPDCDRAALGFVNHLSYYDLALLIRSLRLPHRVHRAVDDKRVLMR